MTSVEDIWKSAEKAISFDRANKFEAAIYFYGVRKFYITFSLRG